MARNGLAGLGRARLGKDRTGVAWIGSDRPGGARQGADWRCVVGHGMAVLGLARQGVL